MLKSGVYPGDKPRATTSKAEARIHALLLEALPAGWFAWHAFRVQTDRKEHAECDFLLAIPQRGLLLIEVKGGRISIQGGHWMQNGDSLRRAPLDQVFRCRNVIQARLAERGVTSCPFMEVAVAFPDTALDRLKVPEILRHRTLGRVEVSRLGHELVELADRLIPKTATPLEPRLLEVLHDLYGETWAPAVPLGLRVDNRKRELRMRDAEEISYLDHITKSHRILIEGGPGTGKTVLAREAVARLADRGHKPLFLCFTNGLAADLRRRGVPEARTVRELAAELVDEAKVQLQNGAPRSKWKSATWEEATQLATAAVDDERRRRFGAVIVDEAHALSDADWDLVRALAGDGPLWAFGDMGQSFWRDREIPRRMFGGHFELTEQYRCPKELAAFANLYRDENSAERRKREAHATSVDGLSVTRVAKAEDVERIVAHEIRVARKEGAKPSDIVVLSLGGLERTVICKGPKIGTHRVVPADDAEADANIVADTFLRYNSLERPIVILAELGRGANWYPVRMHIALTRATEQAIVVATDGELEKDARLNALAGG